VLRSFVVALLAALLLGLTGAAIGQWIGWRTAGALPTDAEAAAIARLAVGGPAPEPDRLDEIFVAGPDGAYGAGRVRFTVPADPGAAAFPWQAKDMRVRLHNAGWSVDKTWAGDAPDEVPRAQQASAARVERVEGLMFVADKGDWRVMLIAGPGNEAHLDIVRVAPMWVPVGGLIGFLVGGALGWLVGVWAVRRFVRLDGGSRRVALVLAVVGGIGLLPALGLTAAAQVAGYAQLSRPQIPLWAAVTEPVLQALAAVAVLVLLAACGTIAARKPVDAG
jgi:hypothetical protein